MWTKLRVKARTLTRGRVGDGVTRGKQKRIREKKERACDTAPMWTDSTFSL